MICRVCHAEYSNRRIRCPYCETVNERAEKPLKLLKRALMILAILAAVVFVGFLALKFSAEALVKHYSWDAKEQLLWEHENFPKLDAWYEEGDLDSIAALDKAEAEADHLYGIWNWEHYDLIALYEYYQECEALWDKVRSGEEAELYEYQAGLYYGIILKYDTEHYSLSDKDMEWVGAWQQELDSFLAEVYQMDAEESAKLYADASKNGYVKYKTCYKYAKKIKNRY